MHILMYHRLGGPPGPMAIPVDAFTAQMRLLADGPYRPLTITDLHQAVRAGLLPGRDAVLITFDDGYLDTVTEALPVLEELGLPAVMAVCSGYLSPDTLPRRTPHSSQDFADAAQVLAWRDSGRDVAAHSYTHPALPRLSDAALAWQTEVDHELLTDLLGEPPVLFAYPYGAHDARIRDAVARLYPMALATDERHAPNAARPHVLPRIQVSPDWGLDAFRAALATGTDPRTAQDAALAAGHRDEEPR
ncbi:polysaccharide deacetylase family protein [Streptomyces sp. NPDC054865]